VADGIDEIRALLVGTTPPPWTHDGPGGILAEPMCLYVYGGGRLICDYPRQSNRNADADAALIAAAPEALRFLLAEVERLQGVALAAANVAADFAIERDEAGARGAERERARITAIIDQRVDDLMLAAAMAPAPEAYLRAESRVGVMSDVLALLAPAAVAVPDGAGGGS
jgi:hypothetical protein